MAVKGKAGRSASAFLSGLFRRGEATAPSDRNSGGVAPSPLIRAYLESLARIPSALRGICRKLAPSDFFPCPRTIPQKIFFCAS